jgi:organic radical activating enzyme
MDSHLKVSEIFYSIQGEGITMGVPSWFLRLSNCNLVCGGYECLHIPGAHMANAKWRCDTIEVWRQGKNMTFQEIEDCIDLWTLHNGSHLVITGGEPLLQQKEIVKFLRHIFENVIPFVEIETNGTIAPDPQLIPLVKLFNVSPKLSNSGMPAIQRVNPIAIQQFNKLNSIFKFVVSDSDDVDEVLTTYGKMIDKEKIVLMPAASDQEELQKNLLMLTEISKELSIKICTRLQVAIWNKLTGV